LAALRRNALNLLNGNLDRIEVGRVLRQVKQGHPRVFDRLADGCSFVNIDVVYNDDVAAPERGDQPMLDIGPEHLCVHGTIDHHQGDLLL
jgi:hypothetical protein